MDNKKRRLLGSVLGLSMAISQSYTDMGIPKVHYNYPTLDCRRGETCPNCGRTHVNIYPRNNRTIWLCRSCCIKYDTEHPEKN